MPILIGETYIEWRHIFVLCLFVGIAICTKIHDNKYMVGIYYGIILNIVFSQPPCKQTLCNKVLLDDDGFGYVDNFLPPKQLSTYKKKFVKKYHSNTIFLGNPNTWGIKMKRQLNWSIICIKKFSIDIKRNYILIMPFSVCIMMKR